MQVESRYKWVFILVFITILIIAMAYLVSERLIEHIDETRLPVGSVIQPGSIDKIKIWDELSLDLIENYTSKIS
jgi:hypothetical protein